MNVHSLSDIQRKEEAFHDEWADSINIDELMVDESFTAICAYENRYIVQKMGTVAGKQLLDVGCGAGEASVFFAKNGAEVTATDISACMLEVVDELATRHGVVVETRKAEAEELPFEDDAFDLVYASNVLHHVNIPKALAEIRRILKPGGTACFIEPLTYNPAINVYRQMAMTVRTEDEHPLRLADLKTFRSLFSEVEHKEMWFFTLYIFFWFFLVERVHPNKVRYWKKVVKDAPRHRLGFAVAGFLDRVFLTVLPFLRFWCWNTVVCVRK